MTSIPTRARFAALFCLAALPCLAAGEALAQATPLTRLYAAKPPAGSAFVRVLNPTGAAVTVALGDGAKTPLGPDGPRASVYRVVRGGTAVNVSVDGKPTSGTAIPAADGFTTLVLVPEGPNFRLEPLTDSTEGRDDLKAMLRFYALAPGCTATLAVADGPTVFDAVPPMASRQRAINPVDASLVGRCGDVASAPLKLPQLKAGDHYSLFLVGTAQAPVLAGQNDETEPYRGPAN
ncbi:alginate O-acetyltransferase AlgF [Xanthobacter sp. DSM 24535]|uniref:alginate O-acetyltransferase AlgF n=1 Tax=Roseixanthobacter psychrophilus TaxID=3119917 RepID=UPI003729CA7E